MAVYRIDAQAPVCDVYKRSLDDLKDYVGRHGQTGKVLVSTDLYVVRQTAFLSFLRRILLSRPYTYSRPLAARHRQTALRYVNAYGWCLLVTVNDQTKTVWVEHAEEMSSGKTIEDVVDAYLRS